MASEHRHAVYVSQQTDTPVWTPAAGFRVVLSGLHVQNGSALAVTATFKFGSSTFFTAYLTASQTARDVRFEDIYGAVNEPVTITNDAAVPVAVTLVGYELAGY